MKAAGLLGALALVLCGCAGEARVFPLNDAAAAGAMPRISFKMYGTRRGPLTITMPDGSILTGEYQVSENANVAFGFARGVMATGVGLGGNRHIVASAFAPHHRMNCEGFLDLGGHGSLICESESGAQWRIMV